MTAACLEVKSKGKIVNGFLAFLSETLSTEYWKMLLLMHLQMLLLIFQ